SAPPSASGGAVHSDLGPVVMAPNGGAGKVYPVFTEAIGTVTNATMTFDFSGIASMATPSFPDPAAHCTISGTSATCALPDVTADDSDPAVGLISLKLVPTAGAVDGATGEIKTSIQADNASAYAAVVHVTVVDGPDLVVADSAVES